uniref:Putative plant transposon protein domain-containing protein n=1 Tax=Cajanus cajan TaxID=3821 RepID=A0A151RCE1_CAJCA|nr:hypothetical protein KK1_038478 [Cajanus cajan]
MASSSKRPKKLEVRGSKRPLPTEQLISKWFADEKTQEYYFEWYAGRRIIPPKTLKLEWFKNEGFSFPPLLEHQELGKFLELEGPYYPELIRLFLCFASSNEGIMQSVVKGKLIKLDGLTLKEVVGLSEDGSTKSQPFNFGDFEELTTFRDCQRNPETTKYTKFLAKGMKKNPRLISFIIAWMIKPRLHNHAQMSRDDIFLMHVIKKKIKIDWVSMLNDYMWKARRKEDDPIPYALLLSRIFEKAGVDLKREKKIILHASNKIEKSSLHHMGMLKQEDKWVFKGDVPPTPEPATDEDGVPSHDEDQPPQVEVEPKREQESEPKAFSPFEQIMINKLDAVMEMSRRHCRHPPKRTLAFATMVGLLLKF